MPQQRKLIQLERISGPEPGRYDGELEMVYLMIDINSGKLFRYTNVADPSTRGRTVVTEISWEMWERFEKPFRSEKLQTLTEDNWQTWLRENGYITETIEEKKN